MSGILSVGVLWFVACAWVGQPSDRTASDPERKAMDKSVEQAVNSADRPKSSDSGKDAAVNERATTAVRDFFGSVLSSTTAAPKEVVRYVAKSDASPLVADGTTVIRVDMGTVAINIPNGTGAANVDRDVVAEVDAQSFAVLRLQITDPTRAKEAPPEPPREEMVKQMTNVGPEVWHGPANSTKVSLADALRTMESRGLTSARSAIRLVVARVACDVAGTGPKNVWSVDYRGIQGLQMHPNTPVVANLRHLVDADSGKWLTANNIPGTDSEPKPDTNANQNAPPSRK